MPAGDEVSLLCEEADQRAWLRGFEAVWCAQHHTSRLSRTVTFRLQLLVLVVFFSDTYVHGLLSAFQIETFIVVSVTLWSRGTLYHLECTWIGNKQLSTSLSCKAFLADFTACKGCVQFTQVFLSENIVLHKTISCFGDNDNKD